MYPDAITEILSSRGDNAYTFTVDTTALIVPLVNPVNHPNARLENSSGAYRIAQNDNITVMEIGVRLPYCFSIEDAMIDLRFQYQVAPAGAKVNVFDRLGNDGQIFIPKHESLFIDSFIQFPAQAADYQIQYELNAIHDVSMIGVPDDFHDATYSLDVWVKIKHTLPLF